jgi:hypothetical protein
METDETNPLGDVLGQQKKDGGGGGQMVFGNLILILKG